MAPPLPPITISKIEKFFPYRQHKTRLDPSRPRALLSLPSITIPYKPPPPPLPLGSHPFKAEKKMAGSVKQSVSSMNPWVLHLQKLGLELKCPLWFSSLTPLFFFQKISSLWCLILRIVFFLLKKLQLGIVEATLFATLWSHFLQVSKFNSFGNFNYFCFCRRHGFADFIEFLSFSSCLPKTIQFGSECPLCKAQYGDSGRSLDPFDKWFPISRVWFFQKRKLFLLRFYGLIW